MCWVTSKPPERLIAKENIPIFKVCAESAKINTVNSYFKYYKYELNTIYKLNNKILTFIVTASTGTKHTCINAGYHSYLTGKCNFIKDSAGCISVTDAKGLFLYSYGAYVIKVAGYIPKGSEYYINEQGECVSDSIYLTKIEEW